MQEVYVQNQIQYFSCVEYFPGRVERFAVELMSDSTTDHEAVLSVAVSLTLGHISQLAVLERTGD